MTQEEKNLMTNPDHKPLMDLPPVVQHLMQANIKHLNVLRKAGFWEPCEKGEGLAHGCIYAVSSTAPVTPPPVQYKQYPVFVGSDRIYKVNLTRPGTDDTRIYHLHTITGMAEFAGIRYHGSQEWKPLLDTVTYGMPSEVRFIVR